MRYDQLLTFSTLAEMQGSDAGQFPDGTFAYLDGGTAKGDGLQGFYQWDDDSTETADTLTYTIVQVTGQTNGRWNRVMPSGGSESYSVTVGSPSSGSLSAKHYAGGGLQQTTFTLTAAQVPVTDAAASGSYGTLKLATLPQGSILFLGCRQNYTAFAEGAALTGGAGDASFDIGVGSVAIAAAADGALAGTDDDIGAEVNITLSGGTGTGTGHSGVSVAHDGTTTAATINLNWSGTAATIDANSTIDVTGTITVLWAHMGDD